MSDVIGIVSMKGGVGKTTMAVSLGQALANQGQKVLLIDANFSAPNLGFHFGHIDPAITLHDVLLRGKAANEAIIKINSHLFILPSSLHGRRVDNRLLRKKVMRLKKSYDYILIDSSSQINSEMRATLNASNKAIIISTPDFPSLSLTLAVLTHARQCKSKVLGIILNRVSNKKFELTKKDIEGSCKIPIMGIISEHISLRKAVAQYYPLWGLKRWSKSTRTFKSIARNIIGVKQKW